MRWLTVLLAFGLAACTSAEELRAREAAREEQLRLFRSLSPAQQEEYLRWMQLQQMLNPPRSSDTEITNCQYIAYTGQTICSTTRW